MATLKDNNFTLKDNNFTLKDNNNTLTLFRQRLTSSYDMMMVTVMIKMINKKMINKKMINKNGRKKPTAHYNKRL